MPVARLFTFGIMLLFIISKCNAQIGGGRSFEFINIPVNATTTALGGNNISLVSNDPTMLMQNPALTDSIESQQIAFGYLGYYAGISQSTFSYVHKVKKQLINFGVSYFNYGDFEGFDMTGNPTGNFQASEYIVHTGTSHAIGLFTLGANLKFAHSLIDNYSASAVIADIGGVFRPQNNDWTISLTARNLGFILSDYSSQASSEVPSDIQIGTTFKPEFMPVRFSFTATNFLRNNVAFSNSLLNPNESEPGFGEQIFRRINIGTEFLLGKGLRVLFGYNHRVRKEMRLQQLSGGAGFSFGMFLRIKMFEITYARSAYHVVGGINQVTLVTNLKKFQKAKL